ncbi:hypothetical protein KAI32_03855, partial [Candidatus Pacearchaeota archaeon]|nr:hypothetical protein [Candidatus Pacearchaeota archaeon]
MVFKKDYTILRELKNHLPFTLISSLMAGILVATFYSIDKTYFLAIIPTLFEFIHPAHVLVSAMATSAIYWKYKKSLIKTVLVGITGAILIGSLSDVFFPWATGNLFSLHTHFHLPIITNPILIISVALIGSLAGIYCMFRVSHSIHVFLSIFASLFYILAFSVEVNILTILLISLLVFLAVYIPCCIS